MQPLYSRSLYAQPLCMQQLWKQRLRTPAAPRPPLRPCRLTHSSAQAALGGIWVRLGSEAGPLVLPAAARAPAAPPPAPAAELAALRAEVVRLVRPWPGCGALKVVISWRGPEMQACVTWLQSRDSSHVTPTGLPRASRGGGAARCGPDALRRRRRRRRRRAQEGEAAGLREAAARAARSVAGDAAAAARDAQRLAAVLGAGAAAAAAGGDAAEVRSENGSKEEQRLQKGK